MYGHEDLICWGNTGMKQYEPNIEADNEETIRFSETQDIAPMTFT